MINCNFENNRQESLTVKNLIAFLFALSLTACAGSGGIKWDNVRQVKQGMTEQQLTNLMGRPYSVTSKGDGTQIWVWVHVNLLTGTSSLAIPMKEGLVIADMKIPDSFK